jgi:hypothetical protein
MAAYARCSWGTDRCEGGAGTPGSCGSTWGPIPIPAASGGSPRRSTAARGTPAASCRSSDRKRAGPGSELARSRTCSSAGSRSLRPGGRPPLVSYVLPRILGVGDTDSVLPRVSPSALLVVHRMGTLASDMVGSLRQPSVAESAGRRTFPRISPSQRSAASRQGGGRGFESRRRLHRSCRSGPACAGPFPCRVTVEAPLGPDWGPDSYTTSSRGWRPWD